MSEQAQTRTEAERAPDKRLSRLVLTGFMGAGKSTVGALLAGTLGWRFIDLDSMIEAACGQTVAEIFFAHGESYFRGQERQAIEQLRGERRIVLSLGGGTIEDHLVLSSLLEWSETYVIFLDAPLDALLARVREGCETRPLLAAPGELEARHARRLPLYRSAHWTVATENLTPQEVADRILYRVAGRVAEGKMEDKSGRQG